MVASMLPVEVNKLFLSGTLDLYKQDKGYVRKIMFSFVRHFIERLKKHLIFS